MQKELILDFKLLGQCTSGKNSVIVTRTGKRFPSQRFTLWRNDMMGQILPQIEHYKKMVQLPLCGPVSVSVLYKSKDRLRRDAPGIIDALWHLLEKSGVITDDTHLAGFENSLQYYNAGIDKLNPSVSITIRGFYDDDTGTQICHESQAPRRKRKSRRTRRRTKSNGKTLDDGNSRGGKRSR